MNIYPSSSKNKSPQISQSPTTRTPISKKNILKPIIIGELHGLCNTTLAILHNADKLKKENFTTIAYEGNKSHEQFQLSLNNAIRNFSRFKEDINVLFKDNLSTSSDNDDIYHKILLILSDRDVNNGFKKVIDNQEDNDGFDWSTEINEHLVPRIKSLPQNMHALGKKILEMFAEKPNSILTLSDAYKSVGQYLLGIALKDKDFQFTMIDQGRDHIETMLKTKDMDNPDAIILRNQGMIEEIQTLQQKETTETPQGIIAVMGMKHSVVLENDYPHIANYVDLMEHKKPSVKEALNKNHRTKRIVEKHIDFEHCFDTVLQQKDYIDPDKLTEPSERVMKILFDMTKKQSSQASTSRGKIFNFLRFKK